MVSHTHLEIGGAGVKSLPDTIDRLLELVPADQQLLRAGLASARESAICTPPECLRERWRELAYLLGLRLPRGVDKPAWAQEAMDLFEDQSEGA